MFAFQVWGYDFPRNNFRLERKKDGVLASERCSVDSAYVLSKAQKCT